MSKIRLSLIIITVILILDQILKIWIKTNALKIFDFLFSTERGKRAFNNPFNQKKLTAPARNINVSYSPIALCVKAVFVNTTPINISVEYLTNW